MGACETCETCEAAPGPGCSLDVQSLCKPPLSLNSIMLDITPGAVLRFWPLCGQRHVVGSDTRASRHRENNKMHWECDQTATHVDGSYMVAACVYRTHTKLAQPTGVDAAPARHRPLRCCQPPNQCPSQIINSNQNHQPIMINSTALCPCLCHGCSCPTTPI